MLSFYNGYYAICKGEHEELNPLVDLAKDVRDKRRVTFEEVKQIILNDKRNSYS